MRAVLSLVIVLGACNRVSQDEFDALADHDDDGYLPLEVGGDDCDDENAAVHPGAPEICGDGFDNDCNGAVDDSGDSVVRSWRDSDGDGVGDPNAPTDGCDVPADHVGNDDDCDDADPSVGEPEPLFADGDFDGSGAGTEVIRCPGAGWAEEADDCDDADPTVGPEQALFTDGDGDGWGIGSPVIRCPGPGWAAQAVDCDDTVAAVNPGVLEVVCSDLDDDCDLIGTPDGPVLTATEGAFETVQGALDDTTEDLRVCSGLWGGPWVIARPVVITALQPGGVYLNAPPTGPTVRIVGGGAVTLSGLAIEGGTGDPSAEDLGGAVSNLDAATTLTLSSVVIDGGTAGRGGAIGSNGPLVLDAVEISDAHAVTDGGAVWAGGAVTANASRIEASSAENGGGIHALGPVALDGTVLNANTAEESGGGVWVEGDLTLADGCEVAWNSAGLEGGGLHVGVNQAVNAELNDTTIHDNTATSGAGVWSRSTSWTGGFLTENTAFERGGGMFCLGDTTIDGVVLEHNEADEEGGGLSYADVGDGGTLWLMNSRIAFNEQGIRAGGGTTVITIESTDIEDNVNPNGNGGGMSAVGTFVLAITDTNFRRNSARSGGGFFSESFVTPGSLNLTNTQFDLNVADEGAGMTVRGAVVVGDGVSTVAGGIASDSGGGIAMFKSRISGLVVSGNQAPSGGGVVVSLDSETEDIALESSLASMVIDDNTATGDGGGIYVRFPTDLTIDGGTHVTRNHADRGGAAFLDTDDTSLVSEGADFGTPGIDDNVPADIATPTDGPFSYQPGDLFTCTGSGCVP